MSNLKVNSLLALLLIIPLGSIQVQARTAFTSTNKVASIERSDDATSCANRVGESCSSSSCGVSLDLSDMNLGPVLDKRLLNSPFVEKLFLRRNHIEKFGPGVFDDLPNLKVLDLSHNRLRIGDMLSFGSHSRLETLVLDYNEASNHSAGSSIPAPSLDLPEHLVFPNLKHLSLRGIRVDLSFKNWSRSFPLLEKLDLSDVSLEHAQRTDFIGKVQQSVKTLILQNASLYQLNVTRLIHIVDLDLSDNYFTDVFYISDQRKRESFLRLGSLKDLKKLNLSNCRISRVDKDSFKEAANFEDLDLSNNDIRQLDDNLFSQVFAMRNLDLSNNPSLLQLSFLKKMSSLYVLALDSMSNRNLVETLDAVDYITAEMQLRALSLRNNSLTSLPMTYLNRSSYLSQIDLSDNKLTHFRPWMSFSGLKRLNIRNNLFATFNNTPLPYGRSLQELHLGNNPAKEIDLSILSNLPSASTLSWE
ncbi:toll-like receptor 3 [Trichogramma pretiosum]|uniref:toll-like receptor 3 n=1 Tax=Trichogramma pretiosum TaxID=7493 RepID=UPI000C71A631|nr:toll-like receptor 3 [Trichogramma pretiosum]